MMEVGGVDVGDDGDEDEDDDDGDILLVRQIHVGRCINVSDIRYV